MSAELPPVTRLGLEVLELLGSKMLLDETIPDHDNVLENLKRSKLIQVLYDDVVLGLCNIADRSSGSLGAPQVIRAMRREHRNVDRILRAEEALLTLRQLTSQLEPYRNTRLAHIGPSPPWNPHPSLLDAIRAAVGLVDALAGEKQAYRFGEVNLRELVLREKAG